MQLLLLILEIISGILLVSAVLLHSAKGEGLGGIGGTAKLFSSQRGLEAGLDKFTTIMAVAFMTSAAILYLIS